MVSNKKRARTGAPVIGITGGVGSGKSTVSEWMEAMGAHRIDADVHAHRVLQLPEVKTRIRKRWGEGVFTPKGRVSRKKLAAEVFEDGTEIAALNKMIHPKVEKVIREQLARLRNKRGVRAILLDVPLLVEAGLDRLCDVIVFVDACPETRSRRIKRNRGWNLGELERREKFQKSLKEKKWLADYTIDNNHSRRSALAQARTIWREIAGSETPVQ